MKSLVRKILLAVLSVVGIFVVFYLALMAADYFIPRHDITYGVSFNPEHARYLGFDPRRVFTTILDDWKFRYIRLSAQWNTIEPAPGQFNFGELDWLMNEAATRQAKIVLAIGEKTPRWPECHAPAWAAKLSDVEFTAAVRRMLATVVARYKNHPALQIWQVENEPTLRFGDNCKSFSADFFSQELALVKQLDSRHPTLVTDSGELSTWFATARAGDLFGTTMYRVVWDSHLGYVSYGWLPAAWYRLKLALTGRSLGSAYVVELQGEPWIPNRDLAAAPLSEQYKSMNLAQFKKNIAYSQKVGMPRAYLWGAEWWYWLRAYGEPAISEYVKTLKK